MNNSELIALLNRASAALESPNDLTKEEIDDLIEDLIYQAEQFSERGPGYNLN